MATYWLSAVGILQIEQIIKLKKQKLLYSEGGLTPQGKCPKFMFFTRPILPDGPSLKVEMEYVWMCVITSKMINKTAHRLH